MWITEMGAPEIDLGNDRQQVAEFLRRYYRTVTTLFGDKVEQLFWFCYSDGMVPTYGLLDGDGVPKPAFGAFREEAAASVSFGIPNGLEPLGPGVSIPLTEAITPTTSTFVVPFRQHVTMEMARLEAQIQMLQDQVASLRDRIAELSDNGDD
jgi:hypothetical protein